MSREESPALQGRWWAIYLTLAVAAATAFFAFPLSVGARSAIDVAFPVSNVAAIVIGIRMFKPERLRPWILFAVGMVFFSAYNLTRAIARIDYGPGDPQIVIEQIFQAIGYVLVIAALVSLIYSRRGGESDRATLVDASILVIGVAIPFWVFLLGPLAHEQSLTLAARLSPMTSAVADLVLLAVSVRLAMSRGARTTAFFMLLVAMVMSLVGNTLVVPELHAGHALVQTSLFNLFLYAAYIFAGTAPLHPSMKALTDVGHHESRLTSSRLILFSVSSLTGLAAYGIQTLQGNEVDVPVILIGTITIFFLVLFRLAGMSEALQKREQSSRLLFESSPLPMWVFDIETLHFLAVNDAAISHYGFTRDEFLHMTIRDIRPDEDVAPLMEHLGDRDPKKLDEGVWRHCNKAGDTLDVEVVSHAITFEERAARLVVAIDVTQRNRVAREKESLEAQLQQAQKLEAVGQLAGGVAHDFNNLLAVILNYVRFVKDDLDPASAAHEDLEQVMEAGHKAAKLVRQLLAFSRREIVTPEVLDINEAVLEMEQILRRATKESISLVITPQAKLWHVQMDRGQLEQVLVNLAVNADGAMPDGGLLEITTSNQSIDEETAAQKAELRAGDYVRLSVSDNGFGMSQEVAARIFEPFFTTKPVGQGTGLGLATVYGIVKQTGGYIYVYSEESRGTTFNLYFPASFQDVDRRPEEIPTEKLAGGSETILVVEDEPGVRRIAERILTTAGYEVMSAEDPLDAIAMVHNSHRHIDLLLTDVIMPNLSGKELASRLRRMRPGLKTVFMSGYTDEIIAKQGVLEPGVRFLQKPFGAKELLPVLRDALAHQTQGEGMHEPRILIVDDEETMRQVLRLFLETNHYAIVGEAADGDEAIEMARTLDPDIIVLDHMLPGLDGSQVAPLLRIASPRSRILAFSGVLPEKPEWADGWLSKGHIGEILQLLEELVRR